MMTGLTDGMRLLPPETDWPLVQRIGGPRGMCEIEDVAETVAFLATDAARGYHGSVINIDAGVTAG
jgi:NAD(P)-dependent dehydrogenase (short-subunit alcohol dehydrogenase family)